MCMRAFYIAHVVWCMFFPPAFRLILWLTYNVVGLWRFPTVHWVVVPESLYELCRGCPKSCRRFSSWQIPFFRRSFASCLRQAGWCLDRFHVLFRTLTPLPVLRFYLHLLIRDYMCVRKTWTNFEKPRLMFIQRWRDALVVKNKVRCEFDQTFVSTAPRKAGTNGEAERETALIVGHDSRTPPVPALRPGSPPFRILEKLVDEKWGEEISSNREEHVECFSSERCESYMTPHREMYVCIHSGVDVRVEDHF